MTLTPDQVRLRLDAVRYRESDNGVADLVTLLYELLPDLVALLRPPHGPDSQESGGTSYAGGVPGRLWRERP